MAELEAEAKARMNRDALRARLDVEAKVRFFFFFKIVQHRAMLVHCSRCKPDFHHVQEHAVQQDQHSCTLAQ